MATNDTSVVDTVAAQEPPTLFGREPARVIGALGTLASAIITVLVTLGFAVPDGLDAQVQDLIQAVGAVLVIAIPLYVGNRTRKEVVPVEKVERAETLDDVRVVNPHRVHPTPPAPRSY